LKEVFEKIKKLYTKLDSIDKHASTEDRCSNKLRKLPVIQDEQLVGIITATDLIDCMVLNAFKTENHE